MENIFNDTRGISAIVTTIILVGLVLVVVGIFWSVAINIVDEQTEALDITQACTGLVFEITGLDCDGSTCDVVVERKTGSKGDNIDGWEITVSNETDESNPQEVNKNIPVQDSTSVNTDIIANSASLRVFIEDADGNDQFCNQIFSYEE